MGSKGPNFAAVANRFLFSLLMSVLVHVRPKKYFVTFMQKLGAKMASMASTAIVSYYGWTNPYSTPIENPEAVPVPSLFALFGSWFGWLNPYAVAEEPEQQEPEQSEVEMQAAAGSSMVLPPVVSPAPTPGPMTTYYGWQNPYASDPRDSCSSRPRVSMQQARSSLQQAEPVGGICV
jgi:hypothetical protein